MQALGVQTNLFGVFELFMVLHSGPIFERRNACARVGVGVGARVKDPVSLSFENLPEHSSSF